VLTKEKPGVDLPTPFSLIGIPVALAGATSLMQRRT
jgi:hypothetical protein